MEVFKTFADAPAANELGAWLISQGISAEVRDSSGYFDPSFANSILNRSWRVFLKPEDFPRANSVLQSFYESQLADVPSDYYLFGFTNGELKEIISKPDEWGDLDYELARKLLQERGIKLSETEMDELRDKRLLQLSKPETQDADGYLSMGFFFSFVGGFIGSLIGWHLTHSQKILPDGTMVPRYTEKVRKQGRFMFMLGLVVTIILLIYIFYNAFMLGPGSIRNL